MYYDPGYGIIMNVITAVLIIVAIFAIAIPVIVGILVYRDAKKRVDCSPVLFALLAALAPLFIGVIVYMIIRKDYPLKPEYGGPARPGYDAYSGYGQNTGYTSGSYDTGRYSEESHSAGNYDAGSYSAGGSADPEEGSQGQPEQGTYTYYAQTPPQKKGLPTWAKVLIVIGAVLLAAVLLFCLLAPFISVTHMIDSFDDGGYGQYIHGFDF